MGGGALGFSRFKKTDGTGGLKNKVAACAVFFAVFYKLQSTLFEISACLLEICVDLKLRFLSTGNSCRPFWDFGMSVGNSCRPWGIFGKFGGNLAWCTGFSGVEENRRHGWSKNKSRHD